MKIVEIIEAKRWENKKTGQTASIYGSVPYQSDKEDWHIVKVGYTWKMQDGTIGFGRQPAKTLEEAKEVMKKINKQNAEYERAYRKAMETENDQT